MVMMDDDDEQPRKKRRGKVKSDHDCDNILSIDSFKKSLRDVKSALGNLAMIASRAVLQTMNGNQHGSTKRLTSWLPSSNLVCSDNSSTH